MKILYYECFSGISGDMNLGAMIDLGVDPAYLQTELSKLGLDNEYQFTFRPASKNGIHGTQVEIQIAEHHHHGEEHSHCHRNLSAINAIIERSSLTPEIQETAKAIFMVVAKAEATVHGKDIADVHFHEVGATDSIIDIVGAAICYHALEVDEVWCSPIELGGGFVHCAHGVIPVPAPATVEILHGCPTTRGAVQKETTTPTGAAILRHFVSHFTATPHCTTEKTAYGVGHRDTEIPNLVRLSLATVERAEVENETRLLQCNIDDMTGEALGYVMEKMLEEGAMDFHFTPIMMKKNRPATCLSLLCAMEDEEKFTRLLFLHTTTLGVKSLVVTKTELERSFEILETPLGSVTMKNAIMDGETLRSKPELEDCKKLAEQHQVSLAEVYVQICKSRKV